MENIYYINRKTGEKQEEKVPAGGIMKFLYGSMLGKVSLSLLVKRKIISAIGGGYLNSKKSINKIDAFIKKYQINLNDFIIPEGGYKHFNDFFYRKIKKEKRPLENGIVSPADGRVLAFEKITDSRIFFVKGSAFSLSKFLQNEELAKKYKNGSMLVIRLAPVDYHRYHFPCDGTPSETIPIKGDYYSVSPIALKKNIEIFCKNKRAYCELKTFDIGDVLFCDVGATMTGSIIQTYTPNKPIKKGDEKGYFAFGGSTIVLLFEPNKISFSTDLIVNTQKGYETYLKMGEKIATVCSYFYFFAFCISFF